MTNDPFTEAARESAASKYQGDWDAFEGDPVDDWGFSEAERQAYVAGAEWARAHLAAQEPSDAEVEAAAKAQYRNSEGWDLVLEAYRKRVAEEGPIPDHVIAHRLELARDALRAAYAARRGEEKR